MVLTALSMAAHPTILNVPGYILMIPIGEPIKTTNLEISYASKKAVEVLEKLGAKIKLTKK